MPRISAMIKDFETTDSTAVETTKGIHVPGGLLYGELNLVVSTVAMGTGATLNLWIQTSSEDANYRDYANVNFAQAHTASPTSQLNIRYPKTPPTQNVAGTGGSDGAMASSTVSTSQMAGSFWRIKEGLTGTYGGTWNYQLKLHQRGLS